MNILLFTGLGIIILITSVYILYLILKWNLKKTNPNKMISLILIDFDYAISLIQCLKHRLNDSQITMPKFKEGIDKDIKKLDQINKDLKEMTKGWQIMDKIDLGKYDLKNWDV